MMSPNLPFEEHYPNTITTNDTSIFNGEVKKVIELLVAVTAIKKSNSEKEEEKML